MEKIQTKQDLKFYLEADRRANLGDTRFKTLFLSKLYHTEQYAAYAYLKNLRYCEYFLNNKSFFHSLCLKYCSIKKGRLGLKYHLQIRENVLGYGARFCHLSGGGGYFIECQ